jgi:hypothetical protein
VTVLEQTQGYRARAGYGVSGPQPASRLTNMQKEEEEE